MKYIIQLFHKPQTPQSTLLGCAVAPVLMASKASTNPAPGESCCVFWSSTAFLEVACTCGWVSDFDLAILSVEDVEYW
jgi:hypothetical protein